MYRFTYRYIFLRGHSAFLSQYARIIQQRWRFRASLYSQSKSDAWRNLNFRYKGKLELSVLLPWLVKRDELRSASGIILIFLICASKAARKFEREFKQQILKKKEENFTHCLPRIQCPWRNTGSFDCAAIPLEWIYSGSLNLLCKHS